MGVPLDQVLREQRFIRDHPEWSIHRLEYGSEFAALKVDGPNQHIVAGMPLPALLDRLEEITGDAG